MEKSVSALRVVEKLQIQDNGPLPGMDNSVEYVTPRFPDLKISFNKSELIT